MKVFSITLWLLLIRLLEISSWGQSYLRGKYREWIEDDDRVEVKSWYAETEIKVQQGNGRWIFWAQLMLGPGPHLMGLPPTEASTENEWLLRVPEEIRKAGLFTLSKGTPNHDFSFEYGISDERDYLSRSYAIKYSQKLAAETLILNSGLSLQDDSVKNFVKFRGKSDSINISGLSPYSR